MIFLISSSQCSKVELGRSTELFSSNLLNDILFNASINVSFMLLDLLLVLFL